MKKITLSISLLVLMVSLVWLIAPATAAKKTLEECRALARERGFIGGNGKAAGHPKAFVQACMQGKQQ
jgi:hypothetical protein